jgi:hypothetical protein
MRSNGIYHFCVLSWKTELVLFLRIRNATKCLEYLNECPSRIKEIFLQNDEGCSRRRNGTCVHGIQYTLDGVNYWRCGCCTVPFRVNPVIEDIPHYLKLVELGFNK